MKIVFLFSILFFLQTQSFSQTGTTNSFFQKTKGLDKKSQIDKMNEEFKETACTDSINGKLLYQQIWKGLREIQYRQGEITALGYYAYYKYCTSNLDSALYYFKKGAKQAAKYKMFAEQIGMLKNVGNVFLTMGKYDSSLYYFNVALNTGKTIMDSTHLGGILIGKGIAHQNLGDLELAMSGYLLAEEISEKRKDVNAAIQARLNRFTILSDHYPERLSKEEFIQTLKICRANKLKHVEATLLQFLGEIELDSGNYNQATAYYNEGIEVSNEIGRIDLKIYHLEGAALAYSKTGNFAKALELAKNGVKEAELAGFTPNLIRLYQSISTSYLGIGNYNKAIISVQKSIELSKKNKEHKEGLYKAYNILAQVYATKGDFEKAFEAKERYSKLSNNVLDEKKSRQLTELQTKYETERITNEKIVAENRAKLAESESQKNRLLFWGAVFISVLLILTYTFYYTKQKQAKQAELIALQLKESQKRLVLEKQYRDSELKALKAQMNPHFIFNVLNSIQEFIVLNKKELASEYLAMFAELIRSYLHFSNTGVITLKEETDTLAKYLELEALRFEDTFTYELNIDDLVHPEELNIPTMIIQPFVENAIKHGLFHKKKERKLIIGFSVVSASVLQCVITDNGIGREESRRISSAKKTGIHASFAMEATASRLKLYNKKTSNKIGVETIDLFDNTLQACGTKVILTIPLI